METEGINIDIDLEILLYCMLPAWRGTNGCWRKRLPLLVLAEETKSSEKSKTSFGKISSSFLGGPDGLVAILMSRAE